MNKGFTLIELLVASLILSLFAASFAYFGRTAIKQARSSQEITSSVFVCKSVMEDLRSMPFDGLFMYNGRSFDGGRGMIYVTAKGSDLASIKVRHKVELNTLRSRY